MTLALVIIGTISYFYVGVRVARFFDAEFFDDESLTASIFVLIWPVILAMFGWAWLCEKCARRIKP